MRVLVGLRVMLDHVLLWQTLSLRCPLLAVGGVQESRADSQDDESVARPESASYVGTKRSVGRPRLRTPEHLEALAESARETRVASWWDILRAFARRTGSRVSPGTLRRTLRERGFIHQEPAPRSVAEVGRASPGVDSDVAASARAAMPGAEPFSWSSAPRTYGYTDARRDEGDEKRSPQRTMVDTCIYAVPSGRVAHVVEGHPDLG